LEVLRFRAAGTKKYAQSNQRKPPVISGISAGKPLGSTPRDNIGASHAVKKMTEAAHIYRSPPPPPPKKKKSGFLKQINSLFFFSFFSFICLFFSGVPD
jgi:hypothetical protein